MERLFDNTFFDTPESGGFIFVLDSPPQKVEKQKNQKLTGGDEIAFDERKKASCKVVFTVSLTSN